MDLKRRLVWFVLIRVAVVTLFLVSTAVLNLREPDSVGDVVITGFTRLIIATYLFSITSLLILKFRDRFTRLLTYAQLVWDLALITLLILLTGGIASPYSFLYILAIINASFLLARREALYTASLCAILYGAIVDLHYYGKLTVLGLTPHLAQQYGTTHILYAIFINIVAFFVTAFITGYLAERAITSETALQEKVIDYEELESLNGLIVSNLDSGLITVTEEGMIRVFNRYAAELTGISLEEAYDRPLGEVLPPFKSFLLGARTVPIRGEIAYPAPSGKLIFGVKAVPFSDREGVHVGMLIEFQDITQFKRMEEALKKADRLAAIGELSARIAHEIRNPLASISGSVQLIAQGDGIAPHDKKLLQIVVRESDRLNGMVSDFLAYARPVQPVKVPVLLCQLVADLSDLVREDPRFKRVTIVNACPDDLLVPADSAQMQQVFWNLAVNAAEAMPEGGTVTMSAAIVNTDYTGIMLGEMARIEVRDTGCGMAPKDVGMAFEPFFTNKPGGTGLGLATVYRIIESHGGGVTVDSVPGTGTLFTIFLPFSERTDMR